MKRNIVSIIFCIMVISTFAERPTAILKAEYEMIERVKILNNSTGEMKDYDKTNNYILQISPQFSYFYDPQQYYIDSILNDPIGREHYRQISHMAMEEARRTSGDYMKIRDSMGYKWGKIYRCEKNFTAGVISVRDSNIGDKYRYYVDMSDLQWELQDSVKNILGYDCYLATAEYHGRKWQAWYAPDIPVQDGPWQLCGLPGLIMDASADNGEYGFRIIGIQECNESIKDSFLNDKDFITNRKAFLKMKKYSKEHIAEHISAYTGGMVNISNVPHWVHLIDFIETDYHE